MLVVQGSQDPFGMPPPGPERTVVEVPGHHSLRKDLEAVAAAVRDWLPPSRQPRRTHSGLLTKRSPVAAALGLAKEILISAWRFDR